MGCKETEHVWLDARFMHRHKHKSVSVLETRLEQSSLENLTCLDL